MDFLGIKVYAEHTRARYRAWLGKTIGTYTNKDAVIDVLQLAIIMLQAAIILL